MRAISASLCLLGLGLVLHAGLPEPVPIPGLFNTGVGPDRAPLPDDAVDAHYRRVEPAPLVGDAYVTTSSAGFPVPPWLPDSSESAWIAPSPHAFGPEGGWYVYETRFDLTGFDPATASVAGRWSADNLGSNIYLNGNPVAAAEATDPAGWTPFSLYTGFVAGENVLRFVVHDTQPGATGLRVEMTGTVVPESRDPQPAIAVPLLVGEHTFAPPAPVVHPGTSLGASLASTFTGDFIVVGAPGDSDLAPSAGTAYVIEGAMGTPQSLVVTARLDPVDVIPGDAFGSRVDVSSDGSWIAIRSSPPGSGSRVLLFQRIITPAVTNLLRDAKAGPVQRTNWVQHSILSHRSPGFGTALAFNGFLGVLAIASPDQPRSGPALPSGSVELYRLQNGAWVLWKTLLAPNRQLGDRFGTSLAFHGQKLAVGAPGANDGSGRVYMYILNPANDTDFLDAQIPSPTGSATDRFAESLAWPTSGDLYVGAPGATVGSLAGAGRAYWFRYSNDEQWWRLGASLDNPVPEAHAAFGAAVCASGGGFAVAAPGAANGSGRIHYGEIRDDPQWLATFNNPVPASGTQSQFGSACVMPGARLTLLAGAPGDNTDATSAGALSLFAFSAPFGVINYDTPSVSTITPSVIETGSRYGQSVATDGDLAVVGMPFDRRGARWRGSAYVYRRGSNGWLLEARLTGDLSLPHAEFGAALALQGHRLVVGAPGIAGPPDAHGAAFAFERQAGAWNRIGAALRTPSQFHGGWGSALALDGDSLAIGEPGGSSAFSAGDVTDLQSLAGKLKGRTRAFDTWLVGQLSQATRDALALYRGPTSDPASLHEALPRNLNAILWGSSVYQQQRFANIVLRPETQTLLSENPRGTDLQRLNRLLIEDAYPLELSRNVPGPLAHPGSVSVFRFNGEWRFEQWLQPVPAIAGRRFGGTLALRDDHLVVGEPGGAGAVHLYERQDSSWSRFRSLRPEPGTHSGFGAALAFDGRRVAVGEPDHEGGRVHVFSAPADAASGAATTLTGPNGSEFGAAVSLDGDNLVAGLPGLTQVQIFQRGPGDEWTLETSPTPQLLTAATGSQFGAAVALGRQRVFIGSPGSGTVQLLGVGWSDAPAAARYVQDLLYARGTPGGGFLARANAAFLYRAKLYSLDNEATNMRVRIDPNRVREYFGEAQRQRAALAERELLAALRAAYATDLPAEATGSLENLLLDLFRDRTEAEMLHALQDSRKIDFERLDGHPDPTGWVIDRERPAYQAVVDQDEVAIRTYFNLFRPSLMSAQPDLGARIFRRWQPTRAQPIPTYEIGGVDTPVWQAPPNEGFADLRFLYILLRDSAAHARTLAELQFASGSGLPHASQSTVAKTSRDLLIRTLFLESLVPVNPVDPKIAPGLRTAAAGAGDESRRLDELARRLKQGLTPLGYDPQMLLLNQNDSTTPSPFHSYDQYSRHLSNFLGIAKSGRVEALKAYETFRETQDQFADQLAAVNTAYDNRLYDTWGLHSNDRNFDQHPTNNFGGGIWIAWRDVEAAQNRLRRNQTEINNLRQRVVIEIERRGREAAINNAIGQVRIRYANRQADLTETIGHIEAAQAGFNDMADAFEGGVTPGKFALGYVKGLGNAAAEEGKARYQAEKERLSGLEEAEIVSLEDRLLDANSRAVVKNLLLDIQAALVDSEEASIQILRSLGEYQALVDEAHDLVNRIEQNNKALADRYYADPIHAVRMNRGFVAAHASFEVAQRWAFITARALEYKFNLPFAHSQGGRSFSLESIFRARNALELEACVNAMVEFNTLRDPEKGLEAKRDYISIRNHILGYVPEAGNPKRWADPRSGEPVTAITAFRSALKKALRNNRVELRFNTVRTIDTLFDGPVFDPERCPLGPPVSLGSSVDKIEWLAVRLRVTNAVTADPRPKVRGTLSYGGTSLLRNRTAGALDPNNPDRLQSETTAYPVRRWYLASDPKKPAEPPRWISREGLVLDSFSAHFYGPADSIGQRDEEGTFFLRERPVAASEWLITLELSPEDIDRLEDIGIQIRHHSGGREGDRCSR